MVLTMIAERGRPAGGRGCTAVVVPVAMTTCSWEVIWMVKMTVARATGATPVAAEVKETVSTAPDGLYWGRLIMVVH
jgi:hypothetical protein